MPDTLCRLAIHATEAAGSDSPSTVDLVLPTDCPVAVLIPQIVDLVLDGPLTATSPGRWFLTRIGGEPLDTSMTLRQHAVHDGELILLTTVALPAPRSRPGDSSGVVAEMSDQTPSAAPHRAVTAAGLTVTTVSAAVLAWTGITSETSTPLWTAAVLSAASAAGAVVIRRAGHRLPVTLSLAAVVFAMVAGFLAGPNTSWAPALMLATSAGFAVSILMLLQMTDGNTAMLAALAAVTGAIAAVAVIGVTTQLPLGTAGATLTVLSLAALSAAPKLAVAVAGLGPSRPEIGERRAAFGHNVLTGLVAGWSFSATLGVVAVTAVVLVTVPKPVSPESVPTVGAALFAADIGLLLLLRQRTHIDGRRRVGLGAAGLCALAAAHITTVTAAPAYASWLCSAAAVAGIAAVGGAARTSPPNPVARQALLVFEYLALAAVVPLAVWVTGAYGLVRDLSLL